MPTDPVLASARKMFAFEAAATRANVGAGARQEGAGFESLVRDWWDAIDRDIARRGTSRTVVAFGNASWARHKHSSGRSLVIPIGRAPSDDAMEKPDWLQTRFLTDDIVSGFSRSHPDRVTTYPPSEGPFQGEKYPQLYSGLETIFDDTVVLDDNGVLKEKILLEYKSAKSTNRRQIDGNAHERLSFQMMQYLEIATRYTKCTFVVIANGAFVRYRNKYHINFHIQSDRLRNFSWFDMQHASTTDEYDSFRRRIVSWLLGTAA